MTEGLDVAVRLLAQREHSVHQLRNKLKQRHFSEKVIDDVLETCLRLDLQSDVRFAKMYARMRIQRGYGPRVIQQLLKQEGVSRAVIDTVFLEIEETINWQDEVARVWHKKFHAVSDMSVYAKRKQWQFLMYRGFSESTIRAFFEARDVDYRVM